jgi:glycosyltransferase involved in cell wall biosynthesis
MSQTIQVITSALNEEECLPEFYSRITKLFNRHPQFNWKLLICDNGSTDSTWKIISELSKKDLKVRGIRMSRTFSLDSAFTLGLD